MNQLPAPSYKVMRTFLTPLCSNKHIYFLNKNISLSKLFRVSTAKYSATNETDIQKFFNHTQFYRYYLQQNSHIYKSVFSFKQLPEGVTSEALNLLGKVYRNEIVSSEENQKYLKGCLEKELPIMNINEILYASKICGNLLMRKETDLYVLELIYCIDNECTKRLSEVTVDDSLKIIDALSCIKKHKHLFSLKFIRRKITAFCYRPNKLSEAQVFLQLFILFICITLG